MPTIHHTETAALEPTKPHRLINLLTYDEKTARSEIGVMQERGRSQKTSCKDEMRGHPKGRNKVHNIITGPQAKIQQILSPVCTVIRPAENLARNYVWRRTTDASYLYYLYFLNNQTAAFVKLCAHALWRSGQL